MIDAMHYAAQETLKNGLRVTIRAIRPDDKERISEAFKGLEESTVYFRFFGAKQEFTDQDLKVATEVDFEQTVALVTCIQDSSGEKIIGAGRYIAFGNARPPDRAEVSFTVEEDYHGLGIASRMLVHLAAIARERGIAQFQAEVLAENRGMLAVFSRSGLPMTQEISEGIAHVTLSLARGSS